MSSHRGLFHRQAEITRCVRLIDHYAEHGWERRCERVFQHLLKIWRLFPAETPIITRRWWMAKAIARSR